MLENTSTEGAVKKMDNPEKLATSSTRDEEKSKQKHKQYVLDTTMRKQIPIT